MKRLLRVFLPLVMLASSAHAIVITQPTGLNPGDQYRLAFVTSTARDATSTNIADYNAFVTGVANSVTELVALGTTWTAMGSTATVAARDNTGTNPSSTGVPIYLLNNTKLADNNADLWDGSIDLPLGIGQDGTVLSAFVWTGSSADGTIHFGSFSLGDPVPVAGRNIASDTKWFNFGSVANTNQLSLYAISGILTASPVPAPDADGDGVPDAIDTDDDNDTVLDTVDNCTLIANPTQCDSDADGYGNNCDGDLNNNGFTNAFDTPLYRAQLGQPSVGPTYNQADLNCNGFVNAFDTPLYRGLLGSAPGPSGLVP